MAGGHLLDEEVFDGASGLEVVPKEDVFSRRGDGSTGFGALEAQGYDLFVAKYRVSWARLAGGEVCGFRILGQVVWFVGNILLERL